MIMKKVSFLSIGVLMTILFMTWGCEDDSTDSTDVCSAFEAPTCSELTFTACSDEDGNDYYQYSGTDYYCSDYDKATDSVDCQSTIDTIVSLSGCTAALDLTDDINLKSASISYASFLLNAMEEVRAEAKAAAGCE